MICWRCSRPGPCLCVCLSPSTPETIDVHSALRLTPHRRGSTCLRWSWRTAFVAAVLVVLIRWSWSILAGS